MNKIGKEKDHEEKIVYVNSTNSDDTWDFGVDDEYEVCWLDTKNTEEKNPQKADRRERTCKRCFKRAGSIFMT